MKTVVAKSTLAMLGSCLIIGGCAAYDPGPPTEIIVDEATIGLPDDEVATVYWDHGVYRIDDLYEQATSRDSKFLFRFARLSPGEHHFFLYTYQNKSNYEYNWIYGELEAGHRYKVERAGSSGFLGGTTLWVIRDLTTGDAIAESVDCHNTCYFLDLLRRMHINDLAVTPIALDGEVDLRQPITFSELVLADEGLSQPELAGAAARIRSSLLESDLPISMDSDGSSKLNLEIVGVHISHIEFLPDTDFPAYGLEGGYQISVSGEAVLITEKGVEIDRWRVFTVGEATRASFFDFGNHETSDRALENALDRFNMRLIYDLRRRFHSIPRQGVLSL